MHGKGVVDAIGATVKRVARRKVLSEQNVISSAKEFAAALKDDVVWMPEDEKADRNNSACLRSYLRKQKNSRTFQNATFSKY